jgi:hypothetical protein
MHTQDSTNTERTQTSMPQVGFEPTIPVFKRAKTVHVLDLSATVIDNKMLLLLEPPVPLAAAVISCKQGSETEGSIKGR